MQDCPCVWAWRKEVTPTPSYPEVQEQILSPQANNGCGYTTKAWPVGCAYLTPGPWTPECRRVRTAFAVLPGCGGINILIRHLLAKGQFCAPCCSEPGELPSLLLLSWEQPLLNPSRLHCIWLPSLFKIQSGSVSEASLPRALTDISDFSSSSRANSGSRTPI